MSKKKQKRHSSKVSFESTAKGLTSQAGLIPVIKFLDRFKMYDLIEDAMDIQRGSNAVYSIADMALLCIIGYVGGARNLQGIVTIWADDVLRKIGGWSKIPVGTTIGRVFKLFSERHVNILETINHCLRSRIWKQSLRRGISKVGMHSCLWVDVDSTVKTVYGEQEGAQKGYNSHKKGAKSYHPLLAFCAETKEILQGCLRCGSAYTSNGIVEFTKQLLAHLNNKIRIIFRGDSGFFVGALMDLLDQKKHGYLIKVKMKGLVSLLEKQTWAPIKGQPGWEQCEFSYGCQNWEKQRRFVAVRTEKKNDQEKNQLVLFESKEYQYFCYVTTEDLTPWNAHKQYGQRATCETWIEEGKNQMALANMKTNDFLANAALFQCAILAYNTVKWMCLVSKNKLLRSWEIQTVRTFLIRVAGKLCSGSRQLKIKTPNSHLYMQEWEDWLKIEDSFS